MCEEYDSVRVFFFFLSPDALGFFSDLLAETGF